MGCLKGKKKASKEPGNFVCKKCGALHKKKGKLCKPKKIKDGKGDGSADAKKGAKG